MSSLTTTDKLKELLPQLFNPQQLQGDYYLRFQLTAEISALIDLSYVQESLIVPNEQITAIPNLPEYVLGLMTSRSQVFLALDFAHLIGFAPETLNLRQYPTIVIKINSDNNASKNTLKSDQTHLFGLTVRRILGISRILPDAFLEATGEIPDVLIPVVQKSMIHHNERSLLLDLPKLINSQIQPNI